MLCPVSSVLEYGLKKVAVNVELHSLFVVIMYLSVYIIWGFGGTIYKLDSVLFTVIS